MDVWKVAPINLLQMWACAFKPGTTVADALARVERREKSDNRQTLISTSVQVSVKISASTTKINLELAS